MENGLALYHSTLVSIPFIAGQWSLHSSYGPGARQAASFQSPSLRGSGRFDIIAFIAALALVGFNPLHCGAVVASRRFQLWTRSAPSGVSIPFIAGQWSLLDPGSSPCAARRKFQSPSLRGSGRFTQLGLRLEEGLRFQSPSLRGSGRFTTVHPLRSS